MVSDWIHRLFFPVSTAPLTPSYVPLSVVCAHRLVVAAALLHYLADVHGSTAIEKTLQDGVERFGDCVFVLGGSELAIMKACLWATTKNGGQFSSH